MTCRRLGYVPAPKATETTVTKLDLEDAFTPILAEKRVPTGFRWPTALSLLPMLTGSVSCAVCPHFDMLLPLLPSITQSTLVYTALHSSLYSGVHWGVGTMNPSENTQYALAAVVPCVLWGGLFAFSLFPYSAAQWSGGLLTTALSYLLTLGLDHLYRKQLPAWFFPYKVWVTLLSLFSLGCLYYGTYRFPAVTLNPKPLHPVPAIHQIVQKS